MEWLSEEELKRIFSKNLNYYINLNQKSQKEVADAIGVIPTTFSSWTRGVSLPRMGKVEKLADYFHIPKSYLIEDRTEEKSKYDIEVAQMLNSIKNNHDLRNFVKSYMQLSSEQQAIVANLVDSMNR